MLSLHYHEVIGNIEETEKKNNIFNGWCLYAKFDDTKILNDTDKILPVDIILQNVVISMTCFIKNDNKFFLQIYLEEALLVA